MPARTAALQPGGEAQFGWAAHAGPSNQTVGGDGDLPVRRRARGHLADLSSALRVRTEEVKLSVPDGRRVRTLLDTTPIRSAEGAAERVEVTPGT